MGKPSHQHHEIPICCVLIFLRELLFPAAWLLRVGVGRLGWRSTNPEWLWSEDEVEPPWDRVSFRMFFESSEMVHSQQKEY